MLMSHVVCMSKGKYFLAHDVLDHLLSAYLCRVCVAWMPGWRRCAVQADRVNLHHSNISQQTYGGCRLNAGSAFSDRSIKACRSFTCGTSTCFSLCLTRSVRDIRGDMVTSFSNSSMTEGACGMRITATTAMTR